MENLFRVGGETIGAIVITVAHEALQKLKLADLAGMQNKNLVLIDVRSAHNGREAIQAGFAYRVRYDRRKTKDSRSNSLLQYCTSYSRGSG